MNTTPYITAALLLEQRQRLALLLSEQSAEAYSGLIKANYYNDVTVRGILGLLLLEQRCGRSDASKRPFLAAPHPSKFLVYRPILSGRNLTRNRTPDSVL
jgi:hypothetical protein